MTQQQYILPFEAARDEAMALIRMLRSACLPMTRGRIEGVAELLERLLLLSHDCREIDGWIECKAQVSAIAARITARTSRKERTVQNWTKDAKSIGILSVDYTSQQYGGHSWNRYRIDMNCLRTLLNEGRSGVKRGEMVSPPGGEMVSPPRGETNSPLHQRSKRSTPPPLSEVGGYFDRTIEKENPMPRTVTAPRAHSVSVGPHDSMPRTVTAPRANSVSVEAVEVAFERLGVGIAGLLISQALDRGCTLRSLLAITHWFVRSLRANPARWKRPASVLMVRLKRAKPGVPAWMGWIPGEQPVVARPKRPTLDREQLQQKREEARRIAGSGPSMLEQLRALQLSEINPTTQHQETMEPMPCNQQPQPQEA
jgi:hypothetical protein